MSRAPSRSGSRGTASSGPAVFNDQDFDRLVESAGASAAPAAPPPPMPFDDEPDDFSPDLVRSRGRGLLLRVSLSHRARESLNVVLRTGHFVVPACLFVGLSTVYPACGRGGFSTFVYLLLVLAQMLAELRPLLEHRYARAINFNMRSHLPRCAIDFGAGVVLVDAAGGWFSLRCLTGLAGMAFAVATAAVATVFAADVDPVDPALDWR
eukprot:TRINITY_DN36051_c0_g1_i1.p1 TRINITY_DN36051_c0_g1~~TRINITY_DN36051_c0_g1_i1.p1  ORF type:complete len:209 (+),score=30.89 TRINITY_DN36051_c0_g1_i1:135-761(+)